MSILITKPGEALHRVEKRAVDSIKYSLDLKNILEELEIITSIKGSSSLVDLTGVRSRKGKFIELQILPNDNGSAPFLEYQVTIIFETNLGNTKSASFLLRTYK